MVHPSLDMVLPSSHYSPVSLTPFPQILEHIEGQVGHELLQAHPPSTTQSEHPSLFLTFPSSHCSPLSTIAFPQSLVQTDGVDPTQAQPISI